MASATKVCRVCGKAYEACRSADRRAGVFRWQEVACSPECGAIYLRQINESRGVFDTRKKEKRRKNIEQMPVTIIVESDPEEVTAPPANETSVEID